MLCTSAEEIEELLRVLTTFDALDVRLERLRRCSGDDVGGARMVVRPLAACLCDPLGRCGGTPRVSVSGPH